MDARVLDIVRLARAGQRQRALVALRSYLQTCPEDVEAWIALGSLAPDAKIAHSALRQALRLDPENAAAQRALAALVAPQPAPPAAVTTSEDGANGGAGDISSAPSDEVPAPMPAPGGPLPESVVQAEAAMPPAPRERDLDPEPGVGPEEAARIEAEFQEVREARARIWPFVPRREKKRPLGDLLDEARVTRQDLLWAVQEAREAEIREASQIILDNVHRLPDVGMGLDDARLVSWPFRRLNRPLGELVEAGTVRVKDLRRAAWFAKNARLREAARLMLPLAQQRRAAAKKARGKKLPADPSTQRNSASASELARGNASPVMPSGARSSRLYARPMPIIQGSNYLVQEIQRRYHRQQVLSGLGVLLLLSGVGLLLYFLIVGLVPPVWVWPLCLLLVLLLFWLSEYWAEARQEELSFRKGQQGEVLVARQLRQGLGGDWILFRNVQLPGEKSDIDMVLLGPPGLYVVEVKAYSGGYRYHGRNFYRHSVLGWRKMRHNPGRQARVSARLLHRYIGDTLNQDVWVEPKLAWVGPGSLGLKSPDVRVWFLDKLDQETARLRTLSSDLNAEQRAAISGLLRGLCSTLH